MDIEKQNNANNIIQALSQLCYQHQAQQLNQSPNEIQQDDLLKKMLIENNSQLLNQQQLLQMQQQLQQQLQQQQYLNNLGILGIQNSFCQSTPQLSLNNTTNGNNNELINRLNNSNEQIAVQQLAPLLQAQAILQNQQIENAYLQFQQLNESNELKKNDESQIDKDFVKFEEEKIIQPDNQNLKGEANISQEDEKQTQNNNTNKDQQNQVRDDNNKEYLNNKDQDNQDATNIEDQLMQKDFSYETILKQLYNPLALQALHGDIFIDLNYDYANSQLFGQPSLINQYKQVISVENFEEKGLIEINIQSNYSPVYQFQSLTQALCNHPELTLQELGARLRKYQDISQRLLEKRNMCQNLMDFQSIKEMMVETYKKFEITARDYLAELKKTNKLFIYSLRQFNLENFGSDIKKYGYSSDFLQLLGYNVQQFNNLAVRKGLIELQNFKGRIALNKMSLDLLIGEIKDSVRIKTSYITSDNLELQVDGIVKQVFNTDSGIQNNVLLNNTEFLSIVVLDVNNDTMKQIYSIRQANKQTLNCSTKSHQNQINQSQKQSALALSQSNPQINQTSVFGGPAFTPIFPNSEEIDVDEYYSMETQILLEKFYEDKSSAKRKVSRVKRNQVQEERKEVIQLISSNKHIFQQKTCGYRRIKSDQPQA